ncbi:MAG: YIEGIA family protein [Bacillota bacterium]|jgi:hypothetical protein
MPHGQSIGLGLAMGILARVVLLRSDYRQYPTYPHGYASHLFLGIIAALVGAVSIPALIAKEWTAVTFFVIVAQQFREIRSMERDSLAALEETQLVARGSDYIESIARVFEARYYIVIFVAASAAYGAERGGVLLGIVLGVIAFAGSTLVIKPEPLSRSVEVEPAQVNFKGADLYVGDMFIMNVGLEESRKSILEHGIGAILTPKTETARDTLANLGQRQAILHDVAGILGVKKDIDTPEYTPMATRNIQTGRVGIFIVPEERDAGLLINIIKRTPVLESARGRSLYHKLS